ncbi:McrB family protein [Aeromonas molluscorum]|nr:AAA family ATPase [Aeromonas molluscorum]
MNHLAEHSGLDLWSTTDLGQLDTLLADYGLGGQLAEVGNYGNGTARNALRQWRDYVESKTSTAELKTQPATYLLTWNPEHAQDGGNAGVNVGKSERWPCSSTKPQPGDRVYLIRLGVDPRGMVARGTVTEGSFEDADWREPSKTRHYIRFCAEETRPDCASGLLPIVLLEQISEGSFKWSAQSSGISIPPALAKQLDTVWEEGRELHSLSQCARWFQAQPEWYNDSWKPQYRSRVEAIKAIQSGQKTLDDETLDWLWREGSNGVCTVSPGHLPNAEYEQNIGLLRELATLILQDPGRGTYERIFDRWNAAKEAGLFRQTYTAVIHRVFAAVAPESYSTLVNVQHCRTLLRRFTRDFELQTLDSRDWFQLNNSIKHAMQEAGVPDSQPIDNNILAWIIYEAFSKSSNEIGSGSAQPPLSPQNILEELIVTNKAPLNQILFGPPGTGKTYHTIDKTLAILNPSLLIKPGVTRDELTAAFTRYQEEGQVAFVTFHQSFSYEDFVEGIRAESREDGTLEYKVEPGVFARLCGRAGRGVVVTDDPFEQSLRELTKKAEQSDDDGWLPMQTSRGKGFRTSYSPEKRTFLIVQDDRQGERPPERGNMDNVRTLYETGKGGYSLSYEKGMLNYLKKHCGLPAQYEPPVSVQRKPFVLIIDEINRGNVSRIFGELITLIEPSKRAGACEALTTTLPYSKRPFSVPDNLYLIGTMNTADRSLAGLDIALRRRFEFEEMPPRPDLLEGVVIEEGGHSVNVGELLNVLNQRIEVLLDRDHCLGHAYFMQLNDDPTLERLSKIFQNQVLPLLQEYFFEDWQRIAWVLNDHRKSSPETMFLQAPKLEIKALLGDDVPVGGQRRRWTLSPAAFGNIVAYALTIAGDKGAQ